MAELKTKATEASVERFLETIPDRLRADECRTLVAIMRELTGSEPAMWGESIVGFGRYHYRYASGREGDWFLTGFSPRKSALTIYIMAGFDGCEALMARLGAFTTGKSCLYVKKLADVDLDVLGQLIAASTAHLRQLYPPR